MVHRRDTGMYSCATDVALVLKQGCTGSGPREGLILLSLVEGAQARRADLRLTKIAFGCLAWKGVVQYSGGDGEVM